jgi:hypothetical protein
MIVLDATTDAGQDRARRRVDMSDQHDRFPPNAQLQHGDPARFGGYPQGAPPQKVPVKAVVALVLSGLAFLTGFVPVLATVLALTGIVLSIVVLASRTPRKWLQAIALPLAGIGLLFNVLVTIAVFSPDFHAGFECGFNGGTYAGGTCS